MRTDPRPAQVRAIVERVFQGYLRAASAADKKAPRGYPVPSCVFPRLYEPDREPCGARRRFADGAPPEIDETILIDEGRYVARSYRSEGYMAMWLVAVGIVQFYDSEGQMLTTVNLFETLRPERMAA